MVILSNFGKKQNQIIYPKNSRTYLLIWYAMIQRRDIILKMLKNINGCRLKQILKGYARRSSLNLIGNRKASEVKGFNLNNLPF